MRRIQFTVRGNFPPKKDGANSMWGKSSERERLIALRRAALGALGSGGPLETDIGMIVEIHGSKQCIAGVGDLDNFITGICDGLMAASQRVGQTDGWAGDPLIDPSRCIAIRDDREVVEIIARKIGDESTEPWYTVTLVGA